MPVGHLCFACVCAECAMHSFAQPLRQTVAKNEREINAQQALSAELQAAALANRQQVDDALSAVQPDIVRKETEQEHEKGERT